MPYQQQRGKCHLAESLSSEHEILVNKTPRPEAENDIRETNIRETGTNFNNETATSSVFAKH